MDQFRYWVFVQDSDDFLKVKDLPEAARSTELVCCFKYRYDAVKFLQNSYQPISFFRYFIKDTFTGHEYFYEDVCYEYI